VWKDLFLILLEKLKDGQRELLARYFSSAAHYMIHSIYYPVEKNMKGWENLLSQIRKQKIGRGHLDKLTRSMDHLGLFIEYRDLRDSLDKAE
jgi:hypothetical protein